MIAFSRPLPNFLHSAAWLSVPPREAEAIGPDGGSAHADVGSKNKTDNSRLPLASSKKKD
jgi:hypothetical protein